MIYCEVCANALGERGTRRQRRFCSDKCKQMAYRRRHSERTPRRRGRVVIDLATLENYIITSWANGDGPGAAALMAFAEHIHAKLDTLAIEKRVDAAHEQQAEIDKGMAALLNL